MVVLKNAFWREDMFGFTWDYEADLAALAAEADLAALARLAEAPRSMVPASLVRAWRAQMAEVDHVSDSEESDSEKSDDKPASSPSPPWSDDEAREFVLPPSCSCVNVDEHDYRV